MNRSKKITEPAREVLASPDYREFIAALKSRVLSARISAARMVNSELILLYWDIGRGIVEKQQNLGWGESVVEFVAADLRRAFPGVKGFSARNVWDMRRFYLSYTDADFLSQVARELALSKGDRNLRQPAAESPGKHQGSTPRHTQALILQQLVAEIPWGQNLLIINKTSAQPPPVDTVATMRIPPSPSSWDHVWPLKLFMHHE